MVEFSGDVTLFLCYAAVAEGENADFLHIDV
jgi:hypothetical protein